MRRTLVLASAVALVASLAAAGAAPTPEEGSIDPSGRATAWVPGPIGGQRTITLQYGPYTIGPGQDLSRVDLEVVGANGFVIAARPALRLPDGTQPLNTHVHIHHAHWVWWEPTVNPANPSGGAGRNYWFFGTGEEKTEGSIALRAEVENAERGTNLMYGIPMEQSERLLLVSMVHNKSAAPVSVWIEATFEFVDGTRDQIAAAPATPPAGYPADRPWWGDVDMHPLIPTLYGDTFNVPKDLDGTFVYPFESSPANPYDPRPGSAKVGIGQEWVAPWDGTIVVGAGHVHGGGKQVVVENLGQAGDVCANDDLGISSGTTLFRSDAIYRPVDVDGNPATPPVVVSPSEDLQMGITKPGWRARFRAGDKLVINGTYDTSQFAYWDAMSFFGFYTDTTEGRAPGESCAPPPLYGPDDFEMDGVLYDGGPIQSIPNRPWSYYTQLQVCGVGSGSPPCERFDERTWPAQAGPETNTVTIAGFKFLPGDLATVGVTGAPVVSLGDRVRFVNADIGAAVRHTVTSCPGPCDGTYVANYPQSDGLFDSAILGPDALVTDTYNKGGYIYWDLDTNTLPGAGTYTYFCRIHPFMRGQLIVQ